MALLKPEQAAKHLGITLERLGELTEGNQIAHYTLGSAVRYRAEDLDAFVEQSEALWERHELEPSAAGPQLVAPEPKSDITAVERETRRSLARSLVESSTGPGIPKEGKVFARQVGEIETEDGGRVEVGDAYAGLRDDQIGGCGFPPEDT